MPLVHGVVCHLLWQRYAHRIDKSGNQGRASSLPQSWAGGPDSSAPRDCPRSRKVKDSRPLCTETGSAAWPSGGCSDCSSTRGAMFMSVTSQVRVRRGSSSALTVDRSYDNAIFVDAIAGTILRKAHVDQRRLDLTLMSSRSRSPDKISQTWRGSTS